jgi:hypothetical protein
MDSMRVLVVGVVVLALLMNACSAQPSVVDYAEEVEALVVTMNARLDGLDADLEQSWDLDHLHTYAEQRVAARSALIDGLGSLVPPGEVAELHETALEILKRVTVAEVAMADRIMTWTSESDIEPIWETPEGVAARTADADAIAMCLAAQAEFDQTAGRAEFENAPWIPPEMKEVILVAFGCEAKDR